MFFKKNPAKQKRKKSVTIYISELRKQIIIAPKHINDAGIYYEQDTCTILSYPTNALILADEVLRNFDLFSLKDKNLRNEKLTDWPAFKCSKMKSVKSFEAAFVRIAVSGNNESNIILCIEAPLAGEDNLTINSAISAGANKEDLIKRIMKVYHMSLSLK